MKFYVLESEGASFEPKILTEQRFAKRVFGVDPGDIPAVVLDRGFHQRLTGKLFSTDFLPTGREYSAQQIWNAYKQLYGKELGRSDWLDAIWPYFKQLGVQP